MDPWTEALDPWLTTILESGDLEVVEGLLSGRLDRGLLNPLAPVDLVLGVLDRLDEEQILVLDTVLSQWVDARWGQVFGTDIARRTRQSTAWSTVCQLTAMSVSLPSTGAALRHHVLEARTFLGGLSTGPANDVLGDYLLAISRHQLDRSLEGYWWQLCAIPPGVPYYHGRYGVEGLARLGPPPDTATDFPARLPRALLKLFRALDVTVELQLVPAGRAQDEAVAAALTAYRLFPLPARWAESLLREYRKLASRPRSWVDAGFPLLTLSGSNAGPARPSLRRPLQQISLNPAIKDRREDIKDSLERGDADAESLARAVLAECQAYADHTGDSEPLVISLRMFSSATQDRQPQLSTSWALEAFRLEPWSPYSMTTLTRALVKANLPRQARAVGWWGIQRFPYNEHAWSVLGEALKASGELELAHQVYAHAYRRFPTNMVIKGGYGEILFATGDRPAAVRLWASGASNAVTRRRLADQYVAMRRFADARKIYAEIIDSADSPTRDTSAAALGLAFLELHATGSVRANRAQIALQHVMKAAERDQHNPRVLQAQAILLKALGRAAEAETVREELQSLGEGQALNLEDPADAEDLATRFEEVYDAVSVAGQGDPTSAKPSARVSEAGLPVGRPQDAGRIAPTSDAHVTEVPSPQISTSVEPTMASRRTSSGDEEPEPKEPDPGAVADSVVGPPSGVDGAADPGVESSGAAPEPTGPDLGPPEEAEETREASGPSGALSSDLVADDGVPASGGDSTEPPTVSTGIQDRTWVDIFVSEARFLRTQAALGADGYEATTLGALRDLASRRVDDILQEFPADQGAAVENVLASIDRGDLDKAADVLDHAAGGTPSSLPWAIANARFKRVAARREQRPFSAEAVDDLIAPLRAVPLPGPHRMLELLAEGRASVALSDHDEPEKRASIAFGRLQEVAAITEVASPDTRETAYQDEAEFLVKWGSQLSAELRPALRHDDEKSEGWSRDLDDAELDALEEELVFHIPDWQPIQRL